MSFFFHSAMNVDRPNALHQLAAEVIDWHPAVGSPYHFTAKFGNIQCELRLNDFPEENIATLYMLGEQYELENFPALWRLPKHRGE